jgi:hypothetical protein
VRHVSHVAAGLTALALLGCGLTGCSHSTGAYCSSLRADKQQLERLSADAARPGSDALARSVDVLSRLRDEAPDDISEEWKTLVSALRDLVSAVRATGVDYSAFGSGKRPPGVSVSAYRAVQQAADELSSTRVQQAGASIEQQAIDVCKVDLGGGLGGGTAGAG